MSAQRSSTIEVPEIQVPFPLNRHPDYDHVRNRTYQWAVERGIMTADAARDHLDGLRYTDLITGYYVGAPLPALCAINDFSVWFFAWDDRHDRDAVHGRTAAWYALQYALGETLRAPDRHTGHDEPLVAGFADCVLRLQERLGSGWAERFASHFCRTIAAYGREFHNRTSGRIPSVAEYLSLRRHTFGMGVWLDCLELAADRVLPETVRLSEPYREAGWACQEFAAWFNDLHSMAKEAAVRDVHNLGILLAREAGVSLREGARLLAACLRARVRDFERAEQGVCLLAERLPELEREAVQSCLYNMRNWISSVHWFHYRSTRYQIAAWADPTAPPYVHDSAPQGRA
ncbi:multidrug MFS transporter [Streptomyces sp. NPDC001410]|uniref:terpene synthase family protein n=1 Tax=Streptomyces sp. NPDC001410 TaxID=3364574 RepID=UPI0036CD6CFB